MHQQFIEPKTYMIVARRASSDTTFCELTAVKNSLRYWSKWAYLVKVETPYLVYKFNKDMGMYELTFDGQSAADLFADGLSAKEIQDTLRAVHSTL